MPTFTYKSVKSSIGRRGAVAATAGITLAAALVGLAGSPGAAAAASSAATSPAADTRLAPTPLKAALLSVSDLPASYTALGQPTVAWVDLPESHGNTCDSGTWTSPAKPAGTTTRLRVATVSFVKQPKPTYLFEILYFRGDRNARADVAEVAALPRLCPTLTIDSETPITMSFFPMAVPRLGDASTGVRFVVRMGREGLAVYGKAIVVAAHGMSVTIVSGGENRTDTRELKKIAATAVEKL